MLVSKSTEFEDLVQGNVGDPEASLMINGKTMWHVEEGSTPGFVGLVC
jgi:hypothetical protein